MTARASLLFLLTILLATHGQAASDTDVLNFEVTSVVIEKDTITVVADADVSMLVISPPGEGGEKPGRSFLGQPAMWVRVQAQQATFIVHRPDGGHDEAWEMSVAAARDLKAGKAIGRIGFYRPEVVIEKNRVTSITGKAFIYPVRK